MQNDELLKYLIMSDRPLLLYGAGLYGKLTLTQLELLGIPVAGFLDGNSSRHGCFYCGKPIFPFDTQAERIHESNIIVTVINTNMLAILARLREMKISEDRIFTNNLTFSQIPELTMGNSFSVNPDFELYGLSRHLPDAVSLNIFQQRYRHAVLGDRPFNSPGVLQETWPEEAARITDLDAVLPDSPIFIYRKAQMLWWDLWHRKEFVLDKELILEFQNEDCLPWKILFTVLSHDSTRRVQFRPGSDPEKTYLRISSMNGYAPICDEKSMVGSSGLRACDRQPVLETGIARGSGFIARNAIVTLSLDPTSCPQSHAYVSLESRGFADVGELLTMPWDYAYFGSDCRLLNPHVFAMAAEWGADTAADMIFFSSPGERILTRLIRSPEQRFQFFVEAGKRGLLYASGNKLFSRELLRRVPPKTNVPEVSRAALMYLTSILTFSYPWVAITREVPAVDDAEFFLLMNRYIAQREHI